MDIQVKKRNGRLEGFNVDKINVCAERACEDLSDVSASEIVLDAQLQLYNKIPTTEIDQALILSARDKIFKEPNYSFAASRLLLNCLYKEVFREGVDSDILDLQYRKTFIQNIKLLVKNNRFDKRLLSFDLKKLSETLEPARDLSFKYLGLKTLHDRYFIRQDDKIMESPQGFWMRVAMGLAINEDNKEASAIEFYNLMSRMRYTPSTPTLFNSGTSHSQLSSCYLNTFDDSIDGIFDGAWQEARKSKFAGGLGLDVTPFRSTGSHISGTNGVSSGLIPWLKIYNDLLIAVNQGGKRPGAGCAYLEPWHLDFEDFLNLRRNTGDDRLRCHDMNTASWIPDIFMRKAQAGEDWYMFDPRECPDLHDIFGEAFDKKYELYSRKAEAGEISNFRKVQAKELWKKMLKVLFETSHPWNTFKDPCNIRYTNQHEGAVHSSNLCTEITLHTKASQYHKGEKTEIGETAVCNLGSINLYNHVREFWDENGEFTGADINWTDLGNSIHKAVRMLDNVIDLNFYPTAEAKNSNMQHRPIGLGLMGLHDVLHKLNIKIDSEEALAFNDKLFEFYSKNAIQASSDLAKEKGAYKSYMGSLWDQNILPLDSWNNLQEYRGKRKTHKTNFNWEETRESVSNHGMRNSNVMAIAPTATIGYINGVEQSIEPNFSVLFVYENKSGNFYIANEHFVRDMKSEGLWGPEMANLIKSVDGDLSLLNGEIPTWIKDKYKTVFDRDMFKLIECNATRQKWMDQSISFNLYNKGTSLKYLNDIYVKCWESGLKTTYYLRNRAASKIEKATSDGGPEATTCSIEAMKNGETCESCQ
ncbi:MAG: ribonucleoside-diphosphate reductase subunit alpha [Verrucomicrobiales bacterium]|nr:ribonucleoside-diphosphate reductase subunit alpha [Verrucomicrobiales bacterium]|tara:strand:+ start:88362 stop:90803 length:2442 start_codon:yes stop_codon:yes gene_type:complete